MLTEGSMMGNVKQQSDSTSPNSPPPPKPHKSTTHEERFYHIKESMVYRGKKIQGGTVFFRKEDWGWGYGISRCSATDQWNKAYGRNIARRKYFDDKTWTSKAPSVDSGGLEPTALNSRVSYELALSLYLDNKYV